MDNEEQAISCNIPAGIPLDRLPKDLKGLPVTVRAVFDGGLKLKDGVVTRWQARADDIYKGKTIDIIGVGPVQGAVRWAQSGRFGIQFGEQFNLARLAPKKAERQDVTMLTPWYVDRRAKAR